MSSRLTALDQALLVGDYEKAAAMMVTRLRYVATSIQTAPHDCSSTAAHRGYYLAGALITGALRQSR